MGAADFGAGGKQPRQKRGSLAPKRKKKKRIGFRIDMTPLVDITFLLLTFFMLATRLSQPQVMEMSIPPEVTEVEVKESELLTLYIRGDGKIFYALGQQEPREIPLSQLQPLVVRENVRTESRLITALKVSPKAPYGRVIDVLDELNLAEIEITAQLAAKNIERKRRFALVPISDEERIKIGDLPANGNAQ